MILKNNGLIFSICIFVFQLCIPIFLSAQNLIPANNAMSVSNDMQFKLTFNIAPVLQSSGNIKLFQSNGTLIETINLSSIPSGTPMSATWPWTETLNSTTIRVIPVTVDGNSLYIRFSIGAMNYNTSYYITVDQNIFSNASSLGFNGISANSWNFTTRSAPASDNNYIVSADGTGDFATLQGAFDYMTSGQNTRIFIKNGTYIGLAFIKNKNNFTIEGESKDGVFIKGFNNSNLNTSTHWRSVINIQGDDINIFNLTFINTTPNGGSQAEVLKVNGNRVVIANCEFYSFQDTVLIEGKVYFIDCMLEGDVDFIWGVGTVFFQSCEIRANDAGYNVMARNNNTKHGYAFADCHLTKTSTATNQYLGRDANTGYPYAEIVYLNCTLSSIIPAIGWNIRTEMSGSDIFFAEYQSVDESGNLINTSSRHTLSRQLSAAENTQYRDLDWFFNGWIPVVPNYNTGRPIIEFTSPENETSLLINEPVSFLATASDDDGTISNVEFFINGNSIAIVDSAPYTADWTPTEKGQYTISATATDNDNNIKTATITINVNVPQGPYGGTPHIIPGTIQFEEYDEGGNGYAYFDATMGSETGVAYRSDEDVDIENCTDTNEGYNIGYATTGEWLEYTVNVTATGTYNLTLRVACNADSRSVSISTNGVTLASDISIPNTGNWQGWTDIYINDIYLEAGEQILRLTMGDSDFVNMNYMTFTAIDVTESPIISITMPSVGELFAEADDIIFESNASDPDGTVSLVEYFNGTNKIGEAAVSPYSFTWNNVSEGEYTITAVATDNEEAKGYSEPVTVIVQGYDCAGTLGGTAFLDKCNECVGGVLGGVACEPTKVQAEDISCSFDGTIDNDNIGFEGTGYFNGVNEANSTITFNIYASQVQDIIFGLQYANGGTADRPAQLLINGSQAVASISMPVTSWTDYQSIETNLTLNAGINEITLVALNENGFANIDFFFLYGNAEFAGCETTQIISLSEGWNLVSTNIIADDMSTGIIFPHATTVKSTDKFYYSSQALFLNSLQEITAGNGYLIYNTITEDISITGAYLNSQFTLTTGWNLIGVPQSNPISVSDISEATIIKDFEGFYESGNNLSTITELEPGKAYFILK